MAKPMTRADVLAKIHEHFSQPGAVLGYDKDNDACVYRGDRDPSSPVRCAVGCLIPDEKYDPELEGGTVRSIWGNIQDLFSDDVEDSWLSLVQAEHDASARKQVGGGNVSDFLAKLERIS